MGNYDIPGEAIPVSSRPCHCSSSSSNSSGQQQQQQHQQQQQQQQQQQVQYLCRFYKKIALV